MGFKNNSNCFLNNVALSDKELELEMITFNFDSGGSSIIKERVEKPDKDRNRKIIKVRTITLDNYIDSGKSKPTVIKFDVEGAESLVIDGGIEFFKNNNPIISMEVLPKEGEYEVSMEAVKKLKNLGYQPYFINLEGELEEVKGELFLKMKEGIWENFIFKKNFKIKINEQTNCCNYYYNL